MNDEQAHMARLRAARGLPPQTRENLMDRTRAAVAYINGTARTPEHHDSLALTAFMSIFHPEVPDATVREMIRDGRR